MADEKKHHGQFAQQAAVTNISAGDYAAQGKLDFRLARGESLRVVSSLNRQAVLTDEERDFRIAMNRRDEPEGASLAEIGKKYGL